MRTPTSPTPSSLARAMAGGDAGFSLMEVIAAVTVMALAMGTVMMALPRAGNRTTVAVIAAETASRARAAREEAIRSGKDAVLLINLTQRIVLPPSGRRPLSIPREIDLDVVSSASERRAADIAGIRFFPDGASTGGTIRLGHPGGFHEIRINWFTGRVLLVPPA